MQTLINALLSTSQALPTQSDAGMPDGGVTTLGETEVGSIIACDLESDESGFIPQCAMQVSRTSEIGVEASYAPPAACSCAFETATGTPLSGHTCTACTTNADCTGDRRCHPRATSDTARPSDERESEISNLAVAALLAIVGSIAAVACSGDDNAAPSDACPRRRTVGR